MIVAEPSFVVELGYIKLPFLTIELIGHIAASSANPAIIKLADCKRRTIGKHEGFRRFIDPEAQVLFEARRSTSSWRVYDWPAPGSEDTELGVLMELEVGHGETEVYARVQA